MLNLFQDNIGGGPLSRNKFGMTRFILVASCSTPVVMLNLFQHNIRRWHVIPKQARDDEIYSRRFLFYSRRHAELVSA